MGQQSGTSMRQWSASIRVLLGIALAGAGAAHLTAARQEFQAQVPPWMPLPPDAVVVVSGAMEIGLGSALITLPGARRQVGLLTAIFFTAVFPGNIAQFTHHRDAFGLDTDRKRFLRLLGQPVLLAAALLARVP